MTRPSSMENCGRFSGQNSTTDRLVAYHEGLVKGEENYEFDGQEFCQRSFPFQLVLCQAVENKQPVERDTKPSRFDIMTRSEEHRTYVMLTKSMAEM